MTDPLRVVGAESGQRSGPGQVTLPGPAVPDTWPGTSIGIAISTRNRRDVLHRTLRMWDGHLPSGAVLVIVDDASDTLTDDIGPEWSVIRHDYQRGVAMTKNRCLTELIDAGCEHLFLFDDDCAPTDPDWWIRYVQSPEQHLSWQWTTRPPWTETHNDGTHWAIGFPRGVMLYVTREVVDKVGGLDAAYGLHGGEHVVWQQRIHDAGYGHYPFMDVVGSDWLFWSLDKDQGGTLGSTIPLSERRQLVEQNSLLWDHSLTKPPLPIREGQRGVQDWSLGPRLTDTYEGVLDHVLRMRPPGVALEFGVGEGHSLRRIADRMFAFGFDSWQGLPEKWRDGFDAGMFACEPPDIANTHLVQGLFADTVPLFDVDQAGHVGLVHLDADLYSSTATILSKLPWQQVFRPGTYVVFDEWHSYPGCEDHEQRAWREFASRTGISWSVIGHGPEQWSIRLI